MTDSELVKRCLGGDGAAWSSFLGRFSGIIYWAVRKKFTQYSYPYLDRDIDDAYQTVVVSLWNDGKMESLRSAERVAPYLVVVSSNAAVDFMRKRRKDITVQKEIEQTAQSAATVPSGGLSESDMRAVISCVLRRLRERDRMVFEMSYLHDKTQRDISEMLNMPLNSVSTIIRRTRDRIRAALENEKK